MLDNKENDGSKDRGGREEIRRGGKEKRMKGNRKKREEKEKGRR